MSVMLHLLTVGSHGSWGSGFLLALRFPVTACNEHYALCPCFPLRILSGHSVKKEHPVTVCFWRYSLDVSVFLSFDGLKFLVEVDLVRSQLFTRLTVTMLKAWRCDGHWLGTISFYAFLRFLGIVA
jgi:hypothetical protein